MTFTFNLNLHMLWAIWGGHHETKKDETMVFIPHYRWGDNAKDLVH